MDGNKLRVIFFCCHVPAVADLAPGSGPYGREEVSSYILKHIERGNLSIKTKRKFRRLGFERINTNSQYFSSLYLVI